MHQRGVHLLGGNAGEVGVQQVAQLGQHLRLTGSAACISWLFTRLSDSITTAMKLPASTAISSNRCTVAAVR